MDKKQLMENYLSLLIETVGIGFHIDTPAAEYEKENGDKLFSKEEAKRIDRCLDEISFNYEDPYKLALKIFKKKKLI